MVTGLIGHIRNNYQFYLLLFAWWVIGANIAMAGLGLVLLSVLFFKKNQLNEEIFIGFMFTLILSDSLDFAATTKNIYMVLFSVFLFFGGGELKFTNYFSLRFLPYFFIAIVCLFFSEQPFVASQKTLSYALLLISVPNYIENIYRKRGVEFFRTLVYFLTIVLFIGLVYYVLFPYKSMLVGRFRGAFHLNPNGLGLFCLMVFLTIAVVESFYPSLFEKREKYFLYAVVLASLLLTKSRNSLVAVIIFIVFRNFFHFSPYLGFVLFLVFVFVYRYITDNLALIVMTFGLEDFFRIETLETGSGRTIAWDFAWQHIDKNYFLGKGVSYTEYLYHKNYTMLSQMGHQGNAHNSYLTFWLDTGLIGLSLYMFAFVSLFIKAAKYTLVAIPVLYSVLFSATFESWLTASLNPITIILLIVITIIASDIIPKAEEDIPNFELEKDA